MKILIIDNHTLFRDGLCHLLQQSSMGFKEILEANNFQSGMTLTEQHPDLGMVLLEIKTPGCIGSTSIERFSQCYPDIPLVVVSSEEYGDVIHDTLSKGASGFVCKSSTSAILLNALMYVIAGGVYIPPQMIRPTGITFIDNTGNHYPPTTAANHLTVRQEQVLHYLVDGLSNKEISLKLNLAEGTIKVHVAAIFQALRVNNRAQAKKVAEQYGLLNEWAPPEPVLGFKSNKISLHSH